ncbi:hypothetical protein D3C76_1806440 [compost metagenome]
MDHLGLGWQFGSDLFLGPAQQEGLDPCVEVLQPFFVALAFDRDSVITVEGLAVAEPAGQQKVEQ